MTDKEKAGHPGGGEPATTVRNSIERNYNSRPHQDEAEPPDPATHPHSHTSPPEAPPRIAYNRCLILHRVVPDPDPLPPIPGEPLDPYPYVTLYLLFPVEPFPPREKPAPGHGGTLQCRVWLSRPCRDLQDLAPQLVGLLLQLPVIRGLPGRLISAALEALESLRNHGLIMPDSKTNKSQYARDSAFLSNLFKTALPHYQAGEL